MKKEEIIKDLQTIPGIGKAISRKLYNIGIHKISDLRNADPEEIYFKTCAYDGEQHCRCLLYVFRAAVYFASTKTPNPEKLLWNNWKD